MWPVFCVGAVAGEANAAHCEQEKRGIVPHISRHAPLHHWTAEIFFSFVIQKDPRPPMWTDHPTSATPFDHAYEDMCDEITWLEVPYEEKDAAKSHKARWCPEKRQWYAPPQVDRTPLRQWMKNRTYLNCSIEDRHMS